jgi:hypothetical protein
MSSTSAAFPHHRHFTKKILPKFLPFPSFSFFEILVRISLENANRNLGICAIAVEIANTIKLIKHHGPKERIHQGYQGNWRCCCQEREST